MSPYERPPLGPIPWLPPRGWCPHHDDSHAYACPSPIPIGGPHLFALPDAPLDALRAVHVAVQQGTS